MVVTDTATIIITHNGHAWRTRLMPIKRAEELAAIINNTHGYHAKTSSKERGPPLARFFFVVCFLLKKIKKL